MIHRRMFVAALACAPLVRVHAQEGEPPRPHYRISAGELYRAVAARFPVRFGVDGLFALRVDALGLLLLPRKQKMGATLLAQVSDGRQQPIEAGQMDVVFRLRYERADRTLRAHDLEILEVRWPGLPPETAATVQALLPALTRDAVGEIVLHRFTQRELGVADTMGFEPERIEVQDDGLMVFFGPKRLP